MDHSKVLKTFPLLSKISDADLKVLSGMLKEEKI